MRSHALGAAGALVVAALLLIGGPARFVLADDPPPVDPPASDPAPVPPPPDFISPLAGPSIYPDTSGAYLQYPTLTYGLRSGNQLSAPYQTAFKDGDQTYLVLTLKDNAASITSVVADFSALGIPGPTSIPLAFDYTHSSDHLYQFQTDYFPIDTHGANGPGMVTITATDANGQSVSQSIPVVIHHQLLFPRDRAAEGILARSSRRHRRRYRVRCSLFLRLPYPAARCWRRAGGPPI